MYSTKKISCPQVYQCSFCNATYQEIRFHCLNFNFCSKGCMNEKIRPIRDEEIKKDNERNANKQFYSSGDDCHD
jgi:hypothetical protein